MTEVWFLSPTALLLLCFSDDGQDELSLGKNIALIRDKVPLFPPTHTDKPQWLSVVGRVLTVHRERCIVTGVHAVDVIVEAKALRGTVRLHWRDELWLASLTDV